MESLPTFRIDRSLLGSLRAFSEDRLRYLDEAAALGPVTALRFGRSTVYVVSDAEVARRILVTESASWTRPPTMRYPVRLGVGENIFTQSDRAWSRSQPIVAPAFRGRVLASRLVAIDDLVDSELSGVARDEEIDLELLMGRLALVIAAWVFLGARLDSERARVLADHQREVVAWVGHRLGAFSSGVPIAFGAGARRMRAHRRVLESAVDDIIDRTGNDGAVDGTVLASLSAANVNGRALKRSEIRSHVLGLLLAGNETTAAALSWVLVQGAAHPTHWARLRHDPERADAFVAETLRLRPPAWGLIRTPDPGRGQRCPAPTDRCACAARPSSASTCAAFSAIRQVWPDPERFDPDRHPADDPAQARSFIPFGLGPRGCIGQHLALAELRAIIPALARLGDVAISSSIEEDASFSLRPMGGLRGRFTAPDVARPDDGVATTMLRAPRDAERGRGEAGRNRADLSPGRSTAAFSRRSGWPAARRGAPPVGRGARPP